jgi:tRNA (cmo5U34)-methyltransferase
LLALVKTAWSTSVEAVAVDFSPAMLERAGTRFAGDSSVTIVSHNLDHPLPALGRFDAVVSSFAIHHLVHERKRVLYPRERKTPQFRAGLRWKGSMFQECLVAT